ncbi:hypothetical protein GON04_15580 [Ramlibacter sp. MAH-25]|uniref:Bacterial surface antigen (D15) domain-containing protein n=2 Tax=Ramlibacter pinisoli TaxID=2682844 RepID=A0A6N8IVB3_9BURK|nr:hypothetical protein [Ramlibacter sp. CGMCC 1.13660]MBA2960935.1 hypothetical protein [Ramlibacter sp. CGMCC 1.13660]MVQ30881.1 hypothetical protein [Ramlibacter pinisoli]
MALATIHPGCWPCRIGAAVAWVASVLLVAPAHGQAPEPAAEATPAAITKRSVLRDPEDGKLDLSEFLLERKGFLPVPFVVTEPAVGYGGGLAALFFRQSMSEAREQATKTGHITPPDIYVLAAGGTENGTRLLGAGAMLTFGDDRWRYRGFVGRTDLHLDFYGVGGVLGKDARLAYNLDGLLSTQQVLYRLGESDNFIGMRWIYLDLPGSFQGSNTPALPALPTFTNRSSGLGLSFEHDSRNNFFTPSRGVRAALDTLFYAPGIGSDARFQTYRGFVFAYTPVSKNLVLGGRLDRRAARGDVPFYQLPYIDMRGIPAVRYQDNDVAVVEAELRWNVSDRWGLVGFAGVGRAWGGGTSFGEAANRVSRGAGVRYQIARVLGLWVGLDVARGPEGDLAYYIQVGNAWR